MSAKERLSLEEVHADELLAVHHVHRYELAAEFVDGLDVVDLCCGTGYGAFTLAERARSVVGVDIAPEAIDAAAEATPDELRERVSFVVEDALAYVRRLDPATVGAVVCFEGIEHIPDPQPVAEALAELARAGVRILISFPNSRGFHEVNEHHVTDFGYEETLELLEVFDEARVLHQFLAEGSLIVDSQANAGSGDVPLAGRVPLLERAEPEWANHYVALVGVPEAEVVDAVGRFRIEGTPNYNSYIRALERSNRELYRANTRLAREHLGKWDAAAASFIAKHEAQLKDLRGRLAEQTARADHAEFSAWENDQWLRDERARNVTLRRVNERLDPLRPLLRPLKRLL